MAEESQATSTDRAVMVMDAADTGALVAEAAQQLQMPGTNLYPVQAEMERAHLAERVMEASMA